MQGRAHAYCLVVVIRGKAKRQADRRVTIETDRCTKLFKRKERQRSKYVGNVGT
jgi:hypothetical protein